MTEIGSADGPLFLPDDSPSEVQARIREASPRGWHIADSGELSMAVGKLRLAGVYDDRQEPWFMLRTRIPGGRLTSDQAETIAGVARDLSLRPDGEDAPERFVEITTRQNVQVHWIRFEDLPELWDRYEAVGLTSSGACGNSLRNVTSCSVAGLQRDEWLDARPTVDAITRLAFDDERLTAFLPRKFKVGVSGCRTDCVVARVHDLSFVPARSDGEVGFNVLAGGGLSDYPRLATPVDLFVAPMDAVEVVRAALGLFRDEGDYEHPAVNRFRMLVHRLGTEAVSEGIKERLPFEARPGGEDLSDGTWEDHLGVTPDRMGTNFVGVSVPLGRLSAGDLAEVARLAREHGDGGIRLTPRQDLVITGVEEVGALLAEPLLQRLRPSPDPFDRAIVACTSAPFCKFGILNVKEYGARLADHLRREVPRESWGRLERLRLHLSGCKASCAQPQLAHLGMRATMGKDEDSYIDSFDLVVGGSNGKLGSWRELEVPAEEAFARAVALVNRIAAEGGIASGGPMLEQDAPW